MARMINADALQELCNKRIKDTWNNKTAPVSWAEAYADFKDDINSIPAFAQPGNPLTLEQLREMDGQPVWDEDVERWALVSVSDAGKWKGVPFALFVRDGGRFEWNIEGRELSLYPYPPAQQRWIPVSEKEPGRNQDVLICTRDGQMQVQRWWQIKDYDIATHWMPLPEPPEEG